MTTGGEGGMVTTNSRRLWSKMWSFKDHGKSWEAVYERSHPLGFRWVHDSFGTNWRMTEMQAAIGRIQLKYIESWSAKRRSNVEEIWRTARQLPGMRVSKFSFQNNSSTSQGDLDNVHAAYKCYVFVDGDEVLRNKIMADINKLGVPCFSGSCSEVYFEKAFDNTGFRPTERLSVAKELGETSLMFMCHPTLTSEEIQKTCSVLKEVAVKYAKDD